MELTQLGLVHHSYCCLIGNVMTCRLERHAPLFLRTGTNHLAPGQGLSCQVQNCLCYLPPSRFPSRGRMLLWLLWDSHGLCSVSSVVELIAGLTIWPLKMHLRTHPAIALRVLATCLELQYPFGTRALELTSNQICKANVPYLFSSFFSTTSSSKTHTSSNSGISDDCNCPWNFQRAGTVWPDSRFSTCKI